MNSQTPICRIPAHITQKLIFSHFSSKELFLLRGVCCDWQDQIKVYWCQVVRDEMLQQVHSLDLLYEKETTSKLLEFKLKYLVSYAQLMRNYFLHMSFSDIATELALRSDEGDPRGRQLLIIAANVVGPNAMEWPTTWQDMTQQHTTFAEEYLKSAEFTVKFQQICQMDSLPEVSLAQMKTIKGHLMDELISAAMIEELGNGARLLCSWLDGILEFTILKHEVIVLRMKNQKVLEKIKGISAMWPRKKVFIEGAYKLLLFTRATRHQVNSTVFKIHHQVPAYFSFNGSINRVLKNWYEKRIQEETARNMKLRALHESLTAIKLEQAEREQEMLQADQAAAIAQQQLLQSSQDNETNGETQENDQQQQISSDRKVILQNQIQALRDQIQCKQVEIEQTRNAVQQVANAASQLETEDAQANGGIGGQEEQKQMQVPSQLAEAAQSGALGQSTLLNQILQVGSLFSAQAEAHANESNQQQQSQQQQNPMTMDENSPDYIRICQFEDCLKKRIFYSDRCERIENVLIKLGLIHKDTTYCSNEELLQFQELLYTNKDDILIKILEGIVQETEQTQEVWFDLYRQITQYKGLAEQQLERQLRRQQEETRKKLELKRHRLQQIKQGFIQREIQKQQALRDQVESNDQSRYTQRRTASAPAHMNQVREYERQVREMQAQVAQHKKARDQTIGALNELSNVIVNLATVRVLLDQYGGQQNNPEQQQDPANQQNPHGDQEGGGNPEQAQVNPEQQAAANTQLTLQAHQILMALQQSLNQIPGNQAQFDENVNNNVVGNQNEMLQIMQGQQHQQQNQQQEMAVQTEGDYTTVQEQLLLEQALAQQHQQQQQQQQQVQEQQQNQNDAGADQDHQQDQEQ